jgi:hypothetical protein
MNGDTSSHFWTSRKFWYAVLATITFLVLAVTGTVEFTNEQVMTFILTLLGVTVGSHAATDIGAQIAGAIANRNPQALAAAVSEALASAQPAPAEEPAPAPEPESANDDTDAESTDGDTDDDSDGDGEDAEKEE